MWTLTINPVLIHLSPFTSITSYLWNWERIEKSSLIVVMTKNNFYSDLAQTKSFVHYNNKWTRQFITPNERNTIENTRFLPLSSRKSIERITFSPFKRKPTPMSAMPPPSPTPSATNSHRTPPTIPLGAFIRRTPLTLPLILHHSHKSLNLLPFHG